MAAGGPVTITAACAGRYGTAHVMVRAPSAIVVGRGTAVIDSDRNGRLSNRDDLLQVGSNFAFCDQWDSWQGATHVGNGDDLAMAGGSSDGAGAAGYGDGSVTIELRHPLASGDPYDVRLAAGDRVHFLMGSTTAWPGRPVVTSYLTYMIPEDPVLVIQP